jgi:hypothetical protein
VQASLLGFASRLLAERVPLVMRQRLLDDARSGELRDVVKRALDKAQERGEGDPAELLTTAVVALMNVQISKFESFLRNESAEHQMVSKTKGELANELLRELKTLGASDAVGSEERAK